MPEVLRYTKARLWSNKMALLSAAGFEWIKPDQRPGRTLG